MIAAMIMTVIAICTLVITATYSIWQVNLKKHEKSEGFLRIFLINVLTEKGFFDKIVVSIFMR